ncbi:MAG TPA: hypothetical protein VKY85_05835 [Candidatus Angelobacter sp.]|nr:hypothetical protein [Candidatus Angelobacter sp.]
MADLNLKGTLKLAGSLDLQGAGGKVKVEGMEALVVGATGKGTPILVPPPPAKPTDDGTGVQVISSLNQTVKAKGKPIVVPGSSVMQGNVPTWPGTVDPGSSTVQVNGGKISLVDAQATIVAQPSPPAIITESGQ